MAPTSITVEPFVEKCWLQISYVVDALSYARTDLGATLPAGTIGKSRTAENDGKLSFHIDIPGDFPSSWLRSVGIEHPDCSLRAGQEESGDPQRHVLKLSVSQFPPYMMEHLAFLAMVEKSLGLMDGGPEETEPRAFQGYGLHSAIVKGEDYVFQIPADISVRPFAAFLGIDRKKIIREAVVDAEGAPVNDPRGVPLHSFTVPITVVRRLSAAQTVEGQKTVTFSKPGPPR